MICSHYKLSAMIFVRKIQQFLVYTPPEQADIVLELRNLIFEVAPDATEVIRTRTRTLSYYFSANQIGRASCRERV